MGDMNRYKKIGKGRKMEASFVVLCLLSCVNGQPFPIFAPADQGNPVQFTLTQTAQFPSSQQTEQRTSQQFSSQQSTQFLQNDQSAGTGNGLTQTGTGARTGFPQPIRTVTVPVLPAPDGADFTQGMATTQFRQQSDGFGPVPRFADGEAQIGRPFIQFGPGSGQRQLTARQRQMMMMQQRAGMRNQQQAGVAGGRAQMPNMAQNQMTRQQQPMAFRQQFQAQPTLPNQMVEQQNQNLRQQLPQLPSQQIMNNQFARQQFPGASQQLPPQRTITNQFAGQQFQGADQQLLAQRAMTNQIAGQQFLGARQQFGAQTQGANQRARGFGQTQQQQLTADQQAQAGALWRPDVRMPNMVGPPTMPPAAFQGMFPPGFVPGRGRFGTQQTATGFTGDTNELNAASQTLTPIANPQDPRIGMMPTMANLVNIGSRQRPFPAPAARTNTRVRQTNTQTQRTATNRQQIPNRGVPTFPSVQPPFPSGGFGGMRMPVGGAFGAIANRAAASAAAANRMNVGGFQARGQGQAAMNNAGRSNTGAFSSRTSTVTTTNQGIANAGAFPGMPVGTANEVVPSSVGAFPGEEAAVDTTVLTNEIPSSVSAFPGSETATSFPVPENVPAFPGGEEANIFVARPLTFPMTFNGAEPDLGPGELPPPPPVFPASDINNIPASADVDLFPAFNSGSEVSGAQSSSGFDNTVSRGSVDVTVVEPSSASNQGTPSFPGSNGFEGPPPREGGLTSGQSNTQSSVSRSGIQESFQVPGSSKTTRTSTTTVTTSRSSSSQGETPAGVPGFPGSEAASFPGSDSFGMGGNQAGASAFPGETMNTEMSGFPGPDGASGMASFPGVDMSSGSSFSKVEISSSVSSFPGPDTSSSVSGFPDGGNSVPSFPGSEAPSGIPGVPISLWSPTLP